MAFYVRNMTQEYKWILKHSLGPGETLNLNKVFDGFCQPKRSYRAETPKFSEFNVNEFDEFMDWIRTEIVVEKGTFEIIDDQTLPPDNPNMDLSMEEKKQRRRAFRKAAEPVGDIKVRVDPDTLKDKKATHKQIGKKLPSQKDMSPKEIAWLPYDNISKQIIDNIDDTRRLKTAYRLVRNINGQERTRKLIEDRINELAALGR